MPSAPIPPDESRRLEALHALDVLDSPPEEHFRRITELTAEIFEVPIAAISLVDREREWFKSCVGVDVRQADRRIAFCAYAILSDGLLVVEDAMADARFADNPQVTDGGVRFYAGAPLRTADGHRIGALCVKDLEPRTFDDGQRRRLEHLAAIVSHDLEMRKKALDLIRSRADLEAARHAAESANRAKSDFLACMSHELRTPLNAIIGFADGLLGRADRHPLTSHQCDRLGRVKRAGEHLLSLINDVLDIAKVEAGEMRVQLSSFDVGEVVREVADLADALISPKADRVKFELAIDGSVAPITSDRDKVKQILVNLVGNAVKFTETGRVALLVRRDGDHVHFSVEDTGIGIPQSQIHRVFEKFRQVEGRSHAGGTGLGLALCRQLGDLLGGVLTVRSIEGEGTTFTFTAPLRADARVSDDVAALREEIIRRATRAEGHAARRVILCIEDNPNNMVLLQDDLTEAGCRVIPLFSGERALEVARAERPDLIVLDVGLPGLDGWEVLRRFKADPVTRHLPVVLVTAIDEKGLGMSLGADDYLMKPVGGDMLLESIERLTGGDRTLQIAVVDDNESARTLLADTLTERGCAVRLFEDGEPFLASLDDWRPDLVLLDLMMPGLDGFAVVEALKSDASLSRIPVIVMTAMVLSTEQLVRLNERAHLVVEKAGMSREVALKRITEYLDALPGRRTAA